MKIVNIYEKYQIMPQLATHMLRVAGVGKIIAENWNADCDSRLTTELCLLHDMGNIVKFGLTKIDESKFGLIKDIEYWQEVQKEYWKRYGTNAHDATVGILQDAGLNQFIEYIIEEETLFFSEAKEDLLAKTSVPAIILMYADCRVTPAGVVSYRERIDDLKERYGGGKSTTWYDWTYSFENWMQSKVKIDLTSITDQMAEPLFDELLTYEIE